MNRTFSDRFPIYSNSRICPQCTGGVSQTRRRSGFPDSSNVAVRIRSPLAGCHRGAAHVDGQSQVIDFNDQTQHPGLYSLVDFTDGRKVDHVRIVAKADTKNSEITLRLTS